VPPVLDERHYEDTHGLRLGSDIEVVPDFLTLRAGATYETGASPDAYTNLDFPASTSGPPRPAPP
jgi:long-subunit fatty acid transport protein